MFIPNPNRCQSDIWLFSLHFPSYIQQSNDNVRFVAYYLVTCYSGSQRLCFDIKIYISVTVPLSLRVMVINQYPLCEKITTFRHDVSKALVIFLYDLFCSRRKKIIGLYNIFVLIGLLKNDDQQNWRRRWDVKIFFLNRFRPSAPCSCSPRNCVLNVFF